MKRALLLVTVCLTLSFSAGCVDFDVESYYGGETSKPTDLNTPILFCVDQNDNDVPPFPLVYTGIPGRFFMPAYPGDLVCDVTCCMYECCSRMSIPRGTRSVKASLGCGKYNTCLIY